MATRLIIALDVPDLAAARALLEKLKGLPLLYKVGSGLFTREGPAAVELARKYGGVFLDLKFHDIPNTVKNAVESASILGVHSLSLHLSGGAEMIKAAASLKDRPRLWGITVLTSFDEASFSRVGFRRDIPGSISDLAGLGAESGAEGVVCSPLEAAELRARFGARLELITPGIRPSSTADDQKRTVAPREAALAGADYIVVGRPVLEAGDPARAAADIIREIS